MKLSFEPKTEEEHRAFIEFVLSDREKLMKLPDETKAELIGLIKREAEWCGKRTSEVNARGKAYSEILAKLESQDDQ